MNIGLHIIQVRINQICKRGPLLCLIRLIRILIIHLFPIRKTIKARDVRPPAKCTPLFSIKYSTINWFSPSSMDRIYQKLQYPVSKHFFRENWRVKNITWDYTFIIFLSINAKTSLIDINILVFRVDVISSMVFLSKCETNFNQTKTRLHHKRFFNSYPLVLSDVEKFTLVSKYSSNVLFLASGPDVVQGCYIIWGAGGKN